MQLLSVSGRKSKVTNSIIHIVLLLSRIHSATTTPSTIIIDTCSQETIERDMAAKTPISLRRVTKVLPPPSPHWVGNGFHVKPVFANSAFTDLVSPFLMFDFAEPKKFPPTERKLGVGQHPHRGFETVTIAFHGEVEHGDSQGNRGIIREGDVQWMTAAAGIIHEEFHSRAFAKKGGTFSMAQIWVNLPKKYKMIEPKYQPILKKDIAEVGLGKDGCSARIIAGECNGTRGPASTFSPLNMWDVSLVKDQIIDLNIPASHNTMVYVRDGDAKLVHADGSQVLKKSQMILSPPSKKGESVLQVVSVTDSAKLLVLSGVPINEPIAHRGPFVMNTKEEIDQAWDDFHSGKMGRHF